MNLTCLSSTDRWKPTGTEHDTSTERRLTGKPNLGHCSCGVTVLIASPAFTSSAKNFFSDILKKARPIYQLANFIKQYISIITLRGGGGKSCFRSLTDSVRSRQTDVLIFSLIKNRKTSIVSAVCKVYNLPASNVKRGYLFS